MRTECPYPTEYGERCDYGTFETDRRRSDYTLDDHAVAVHAICSTCGHQRAVHREADQDYACVECDCRGGLGWGSPHSLPEVA